MSKLRDVLITITSQETSDTYYSRSYPDDDKDDNGKIETYKTPVYKVLIEGTDASAKKVKKEWTALRFMPFWNDPASPSPDYKSKGFLNSGLTSLDKKAVPSYNPDYSTHNRYSPGKGAIQLKGNFLIHAGPSKLTDSGWGAAGCVEIIGDFDKFKQDIQKLSGSTKLSAHDAIKELVAARRLFVKIEYAAAPDFKANFYMEVIAK